jgi:hypothetical protein
MKKSITAFLALATLAGMAMGQIRITEYMYTGNGPEFIEITNLGEDPVNIAGWSYDDSGRTSGSFPIGAFGSLAPGESAVITEGGEAAFRTSWQLSPAIKVIGDLGLTLGNNLGRADEINIYDANGDLVDRLTYGDEVFPGSIRTRFASGWCSTSALGENNIFGWQLSVIDDVQGTWTSAEGDRGSPGTHTLGGAPVTQAPVFSHAPGLYEDSFSLTIQPSVGTPAIYYTLDGSDPTPDSTPYTGPISVEPRDGDPNVYSMIQSCPPENWLPPNGEVFKITTVRAIAVRDGAAPSKIVTRSFLVGPGITTRYTLPIISVVTDPANLFDYDTGIYVPGRIYDDNFDPGQAPNARPANYTQKGDAWERPGHIEFFETDGSVAFAQGIGLRIHGGVSTTFQQKSLRVYASGEYGSTWINYPIFGDAAPERHKRLILRNSGNDYDRALCRDDLMQSLVADDGLDVQASRHSIVFVNGEYWGIHSVRERLDRFYVQERHDVDGDNIDLLEQYGALPIYIKEGDNVHYVQMLNFLRNNDMTQSANLAELETRMDVDNYLTYFAAEVYSANYDWPQNNIDYWRERELGGRWRWMLKDLDLGFAWGSLSTAQATSISRLMGIQNWSTEIFHAVIASQSGRNRFITRLADLLNTSLKTQRVLGRVEEFRTLLAPEVAEHVSRWNRPLNWQSRMDVLSGFAQARSAAVRNDAVNSFNLDGLWNLTIETDSLPEGTSVTLNTLDLSQATFPWDGVYFRGVPVTLTIGAPEGYCVSIITSNGEFFPGQAVLLPSIDTTVTVSVTRSADFNLDGGIDGADVEAFFDAWENGAPEGDFNQDGGIDGADVELFFEAWEQGC